MGQKRHRNLGPLARSVDRAFAERVRARFVMRDHTEVVGCVARIEIDKAITEALQRETGRSPLVITLESGERFSLHELEDIFKAK